MFPGADPIGRELELGWSRIRIVGVAQDVLHLGLEVPPEPVLYRPLRQAGSPAVLVARSSGDPMALVEPIRGAVREIDPDQRISLVTTMDQELADALAPRRFNALLLGLFASVALALAAVGLYGVMSHLVTQRAHEIGVRLALGARRPDVVRLVVGQAMGLIVVGTVLGLGLALALTRVVRTLLYQVSPTDPLTFASVPALLVAVAGLASWLPARRATRVDPMVALRAE
jgi:putative ABC transport system permease protein